ncbi:nuclear transport factor 2 family protein [Sphingomonas sp. MMSM20]|uniref:nuclear transport factor 2 family protein n=1 Tax=Sphingomonas lycopersici TaxID=2951807 RepID=UPI00223904E1|nr:nuclear transport factor 2 family protein [Sphingomonas lycopersici]
MGGDAYEEIRALKARYFRAIDTQDWALLRTLFTDDAVTDFRDSVSPRDEALLIRGADSFVASVSGALAGARSAHHGHNPEITLTGSDTAEGIWAMDDYIWAGPACALPFGTLHGFGHYHEPYVRQDGRWLIAETRLTRIRVETH